MVCFVLLIQHSRPVGFARSTGRPQIPAQAQPQMAAAMGAELSAKLQAILSAA